MCGITIVRKEGRKERRKEETMWKDMKQNRRKEKKDYNVQVGCQI
jgi:hypothetical protein